MNKKILITGINGFVGEHVAREFKNQGFQIVGVGFDDKPAAKVADLLDAYFSCDLTKQQEVEKIDLSDIHSIIHLAGLASVGQSFEQPLRYLADNGTMTFNLLQRAMDAKIPGRAVVISTGALYNPNQPLPLNENAVTNPNSPYAIGKLMTEDVVRYFISRGLDAVIVRPFNHIGPGQGRGFLLPDLYEQLKTTNDHILVGNIETKRDFTDVRDIAKAYRLLALAPKLSQQLYNVCSGKSRSGQEILDILKEASGTGSIGVEIDQTKLRPNEIMDIYGDSSRLQKELGWKPEIAIEQTIQDFVASQESANI